MSNQLEHLVETWKEAGYPVQIEDVRMRKGKLMEVIMNVEDDKGEPVSFYGKWDKIMRLGQLQNAYVIPINEGTGRLILIDCSLVHLVDHHFREMDSQVKMNYWFTQENECVIEHSKQLHNLSLQAKTLKSDILSLSRHQKSVFTVASNNLYDCFRALYSRYYKVYSNMKDSGYYAEGDFTKHAELIDLYEGED